MPGDTLTSRDPWNRFTSQHEVDILGEFKNEYGEQYLIYRMKNGNTLYFTGDEIDWQPRRNLLYTDFLFNNVERARIARIIWITHDDLTAVDLTGIHPEKIHETLRQKLKGDVEIEQQAAAERYREHHPVN